MYYQNAIGINNNNKNLAFPITRMANWQISELCCCHTFQQAPKFIKASTKHKNTGDDLFISKD